MTLRMARGTTLLTFLLLFTLLVVACGGSGDAASPAAQEQPTTAPATAAPTDTPAAVATEPAATAPVTTTAPVSATDAVSASVAPADPAAGVRTFVIDPNQSEARFTLDEKLMGQPKTVVGVTKLVNGSLTLHPADLAKATLSPIQIDARDFTTDSNMRNNAMRRFILQSNNDEYRYIVFTPTSLAGLPASGNVGESVTFNVTGDLTISGITKPVTFETTVTAESDTTLSGLAKAQVLRSDFNLNIPNVPSVADVTDEVQLEFQFVALAQ